MALVSLNDIEQSLKDQLEVVVIIQGMEDMGRI